MQDLGARRIADMNATGIDVQILSLTSPGVQIFEADRAFGLARDANDELAAAVAGRPDRYAGLAAIAPQNPAAAAAELERGVRKLGLKGGIVMYAMDYPYQFVPEEVSVTDELPMGYEDLKAFYQTNAQRVFMLS